MSPLDISSGPTSSDLGKSGLQRDAISAGMQVAEFGWSCESGDGSTGGGRASRSKSGGPKSIGAAA